MTRQQSNTEHKPYEDDDDHGHGFERVRERQPGNQPPSQPEHQAVNDDRDQQIKEIHAGNLHKRTPGSKWGVLLSLQRQEKLTDSRLRAIINTMSPSEAVSFAASSISIISVVYLASVKITKIEVKVDTMWAFQMRRAMSEAVEKNLGEINSPMRIKDEYTKRLEPIKPELIKFWKDHGGNKMSTGTALLEIEKRFGDQLLKIICVPCGLSHGSCLLLALAVASENNEIDLQLV